jgi:Phytanoyl-CoA dioxygenase (PhyH)
LEPCVIPHPDSARFEQDGRLWLRAALDAAALSVLDAAFSLAGSPVARLDLTSTLRETLGPDSALGLRLDALLPGARPVRALAFDKTADQNWGVPWHQDRVIAVDARHDVAGYGNWSQKAGVWHCEPPVSVWDQMLFVRLHLDGADQGNGAMEIALGSHRRGLVPAGEAGQIATDGPTEVCVAAPGDVLILKMLTLHRSRPATKPRPRRTFRVDFAAATLPVPLQWAV